jgi:hypothetical protein
LNIRDKDVIRGFPDLDLAIRRAIQGHGCSSKDDISKEDSDQTTGNKAYRYLLEKISGTVFCRPPSSIVM